MIPESVANQLLSDTSEIKISLAVITDRVSELRDRVGRMNGNVAALQQWKVGRDTWCESQEQRVSTLECDSKASVIHAANQDGSISAAKILFKVFWTILCIGGGAVSTYFIAPHISKLNLLLFKG